MKRLSFTFLLTVLMSIVETKAYAYDVEIDGICYNFVSDDEVEVTRGSYSGNIVIPISVTYNYKNYNVTSIGDQAFRDCSGLTSVTIENGVTSIGDQVFMYCSGLTSVTIPNSVVSIGSDAFYKTPWYENQPDGLVYAGKVAYIYKGTMLSGTHIILKEGTLGIASYAFKDCSGLTSVTIPGSVTNIGIRAFEDCTSLTSVTIPGSVTSIGEFAFEECSNLTSVTIENGVTSIGNRAFEDCTSLTSINIPNSVTSIGSSAFYNTPWYENQPDGLVYAGKVVYEYKGTMPSETHITLEEGTLGIADNAFSGCYGLTSIIIPYSVTSIGETAFSGCYGLTSIRMEAGNTIYDSRDNCNAIIETATNTLIAGCKNTTIPNSVTNIGNRAFLYCGLKSIIIPNSVTSIGDYAFEGCYGLKSIIIPNSVTSIGNVAFSYCKGLTSITIGNSVTSIGEGAFSFCENLTSVTIPKSVTYIGDMAFCYCTSLTSVTFPDFVLYIGYSAFEETPWYENQPDGLVYAGKVVYEYKGTMPSETHITLEEGTLGISNGAFYHCEGLTSVTIPESVTSIGIGAFRACYNLTSITINSNTIASKSYSNSSNFADLFGDQVTEYLFGDNVQEIGQNVCYNCSALTSITIPNSVTSIGNQAFDGTAWFGNQPDGLVYAGKVAYKYKGRVPFGTHITLEEGTLGIADFAFSGCTGLTLITIPKNVKSIGSNAFYGCNYIKYYVNRASYALFYVWNNYDIDPYETGTETKLSRPSLSVISTTQTTTTCHINNIYPELEYEVEDETVDENPYLITGLKPGYTQTILLTVRSENNLYSTSANVTTLPISPTLNSKDITASSLSVEGNYIEGDAKVVSTSLFINGTEVSGVEGKFHGLDPETAYNCTYKVVVEYGDGDTCTYEGSASIKTAVLTLATQQPRVITMGNVIVSAESNIDDEETNVGFEWRRTDWTDEFASNFGVAYLYEGTMEGYIRNLYYMEQTLWRYRPYYESDSGNRYYGNWVGIDPTNTSYFEPTVHTYAPLAVTDYSADVKGYAMRGTDRVTRQGFMYWKKASPQPSPMARGKRASAISDDVMVVEAQGNVMTATLTGLDYDTEYCFVAFVKTEENETFYGEQQSFRTSDVNVDPDGIKEIKNEQLKINNDESWYDLSGRKLGSKPTKAGLYINGGKKVVIK